MFLTRCMCGISHMMEFVVFSIENTLPELMQESRLSCHVLCSRGFDCRKFIRKSKRSYLVSTG